MFTSNGMSSISPMTNNIGDYALKEKSGDSADVPGGKSLEDLNSIFTKSEDADRETFSHMRSNILLVAGEHYSKKNNRFWNRLRDSRMLNVDQKLRLTKNHIQKITKTYRNNITKFSPDIKIKPQLDSELQDIKSAELHESVWAHIKKQTKFKKLRNSLIQDFIDIGECAAKVFYDPNRGRHIGYEPTIDEVTGEMVMDGRRYNEITGEIVEEGVPRPDKNKPVFSGEMVIERILAFNLLRDPDAKSMDDSPYFIVRKMMGYHELTGMISDPEKKQKIEKSRDETFLVFDGSNGKYEQSKNQVLVREFYFKPCKEYPRGYFYIATKECIVFEGELPGGIFPICWEGFDEVQTTPRKQSIIKQLRPYQAEINRAASQVATHQVTLGDDKLIINSSAKVTHGGTMPGVRVIKTNGVGINGGVTILPGRAGEQFLGYISSQISEMYVIANLSEENKTKENGQMDIWGTLYGSIKSKKDFSLYTDNFMCFLKQLAECSIELGRFHYPDTEIIQMVGRKEQVNMDEFKQKTGLEYQFDLVESTDDAESILGKQMMINHTLQYVGKELEREDIGKLIKSSPIGNLEKAFDKFTVDEDNAENDILQLERGQMPNLNRYEDTQYKIRALVHRMKQSDFPYLHQGIQQMFDQYLKTCEQVEAQKVAEIQRAQSGFIPTDGYMVKSDFYTTDSEGKTKRATVPMRAMEWLIAKLDDQGATQAALESMANNGALADISQMVTSGEGSPKQ